MGRTIALAVFLSVVVAFAWRARGGIDPHPGDGPAPRVFAKASPAGRPMRTAEPERAINTDVPSPDDSTKPERRLVEFEIVILDPENGRLCDDGQVDAICYRDDSEDSCVRFVYFAPTRLSWRDGAYRGRLRLADDALVMSDFGSYEGRRYRLPVRARGSFVRIVAEVGWLPRECRPRPVGCIEVSDEVAPGLDFPSLDVADEEAVQVVAGLFRTGVLFRLFDSSGAKAEGLRVTWRDGAVFHSRNAGVGVAIFGAAAGEHEFRVAGPGWAVPAIVKVTVREGEVLERTLFEPRSRTIEVRTTRPDRSPFPHASIEMRWRSIEIDPQRVTPGGVDEPYARTDAYGRGFFSPVPLEGEIEVTASFGERAGRATIDASTRVVTVALMDPE